MEQRRRGQISTAEVVGEGEGDEICNKGWNIHFINTNLEINIYDGDGGTTEEDLDGEHAGDESRDCRREPSH